ncbi:regulatory LuxR family protein [Roseiarcus fermentans]|uniref:Regulatory LuxR family protein n=1 Tax=Roseiarcus fermentans TaxID=1473586 RepID=A0A366FS95_9HYPH|nr:regulatory LuxR family protein [Roseiarcus fermentans]
MTGSTSIANGSPKIRALTRSKAGSEKSAPLSGLRRTGIRVFGDMPWGTHVCVFYETKDDLLDTATSYFKAGLKNNELCVWAVSDPITEADALHALGQAVPEFDRHLTEGAIEVLQGTDWYLDGGVFDLKRITSGWSEKLEGALARGFDGMRVSGNAFWIATNHWKEFCAYEQELDHSLAGQRMIVLCTYSLRASRAVDVLDVARVHQCTIARRNGNWEFLETPELEQARKEIERLSSAINVLSRPFPGRELLTPRERVTVAQIVRGASSKEAARTLGVSPRTVEFHRANVMRKLRVKNAADLVRKVLAE